MKNTLLLFMFLFAQLVFGQKDFRKTSLELNFYYPHKRYISQKHYLTFYKGKPKKLDFDGMVYFNPGNYLHEPINKFDRVTFPATRFYFQESDLKPYDYHFKTEEDRLNKNLLVERNIALPEEMIDGKFHSYQLSRKKIEHLYQPFFFKKHEVSNAEYWEFLESVGEAIDSSVYYKDLVYSYVENDNFITVSIYPDTDCWIKDGFGFNSVYISRDHFTRTDFEEYPVVGINYNQAKAFCHWKTIQLQETLGKSTKHFNLKVDLPSEIEWEWLANTINIEDDKKLYFFCHDNSWMTDLSLLYNFRKENFKHQTLGSPYYGYGNSSDGSTYSHPANLENKELHKSTIKRKKKYPNQLNYMNNLDNNNISGMGDNVSEWLRDTYINNWQLMFQRQLKLWEQENTPESLLLRQIALYHDAHVDKDGHLVKGGNWVDERHSYINGKNKAGIHAKTFVSPEKSHSTLGFRYVVYFTE